MADNFIELMRDNSLRGLIFFLSFVCFFVSPTSTYHLFWNVIVMARRGDTIQNYTHKNAQKRKKIRKLHILRQELNSDGVIHNNAVTFFN